MKKSKSMQELQFLKQEAEAIIRSIEDVENYVNDTDTKQSWVPSQSHAFGALKHRLVAFKRTSTKIAVS